jgi:hypothetical protein
MPFPAPLWTKTVWFRAVSSRTLAETMPTRYSWFFISLGTPIIMLSLVYRLVLYVAMMLSGVFTEHIQVLTGFVTIIIK